MEMLTVQLLPHIQRIESREALFIALGEQQMPYRSAYREQSVLILLVAEKADVKPQD